MRRRDGCGLRGRLPRVRRLLTEASDPAFMVEHPPDNVITYMAELVCSGAHSSSVGCPRVGDEQYHRPELGKRSGVSARQHRRRVDHDEVDLVPELCQQP